MFSIVRLDWDHFFGRLGFSMTRLYLDIACIHWYLNFTKLLLFCRFLMASVAHASESGDEVDVDTGELSSEYFDAPLQLSDIMPKNRRLYDKMRPPKFKGKSGNMKKGYRWGIKGTVRNFWGGAA